MPPFRYRLHLRRLVRFWMSPTWPELAAMGGLRTGGLQGGTARWWPLHGDEKPRLRGCRTLLQSDSVSRTLREVARPRHAACATISAELRGDCTEIM